MRNKLDSFLTTGRGGDSGRIRAQGTGGGMIAGRGRGGLPGSGGGRFGEREHSGTGGGLQGTCFKCGEPGHWATNCPNPNQVGIITQQDQCEAYICLEVSGLLVLTCSDWLTNLACLCLCVLAGWKNERRECLWWHSRRRRDERLQQRRGARRRTRRCCGRMFQVPQVWPLGKELPKRAEFH